MVRWGQYNSKGKLLTIIVFYRFGLISMSKLDKFESNVEKLELNA